MKISLRVKHVVLAVLLAVFLTACGGGGGGGFTFCSVIGMISSSIFFSLIKYPNAPTDPNLSFSDNCQLMTLFIE